MSNMKKILSFIVLLAGVISVTSCSDDDATYTAIAPIEVTSADVLFEPTGGTGSIVVNTSDVLSATSDSPWISVQVTGNTISVTAQENPSIDSRSANIKMTAGSKVASVTATQKGFVCGIKGSSELVVKSDAPTSLNVDFASTYPLSTIDIAVQSNSDWITAVYNAETEQIEIETTANNTGMMRKGTVSVKMDDIEDEISILQYELEKDILGEYQFAYRAISSSWDIANQWTFKSATLTEEALLLQYSESVTLSIPITFSKGDPGEFSIAVESASYCGRYGSYYIFIQYLDGDLNYWTSTNKEYYSTATLSLTEDASGNPTQSAVFEGYFSSNKIQAWRFVAQTADAFRTTSPVLFGAYTPQLIKASTESAAPEMIRR